MAKRIDVTGKRFGRLLIVAMEKDNDGRSACRCLCDCGTNKTIALANIRHGGTRSCGCIRSEANAARAALRKAPAPRRKSAMYRRWHSIIQRCENPNNPYFKNYGGRGILMCDRWRSSFDLFASDMGEPESAGHTIERIDNDAPYSPDNCIWAKHCAQARNKRTNITITIDGRSMIAKDWAELVGIPYQRVTYAYRTRGIEAATELIRSRI